MREADFTIPIFNRVLIVRDSEGLYEDAKLRRSLASGKVSKKDNMRICGHDPNDMAVLGIEKPGLCRILVVDEPWHIPLSITTYGCNAEVEEIVEYAASRVEHQVLA